MDKLALGTKVTNLLLLSEILLRLQGGSCDIVASGNEQEPRAKRHTKQKGNLIWHGKGHALALI
jgi:hypothetical protein